MKFIIDRFEEDKAVLESETGKIILAPKQLFSDAHEGDTVTITVDTNNKQKTKLTHSVFDKLRDKKKNKMM